MDRRILVPLVALAALWGCSNDNGVAGLPPPPASGLDARPGNTRCIAPERDLAAASVATPRAFPNLRFEDPVALLQAPGDGSRWFVVEHAGRVRTFPDDESATAAPDFIDLRARIDGPRGGELLGLAFHPDFAANGRAYVNYVAAAEAGYRSVTAEFSSPDGGLTLDPGTERILVSVATPGLGRNGGHLAFGPDGFLYVGLGDGGVPGVDAKRAEPLLGTMLRIDVDPRNCAAGGARPCVEIFARGFRNPRNWNFDRQTGALWLADSGPRGFEDIHVVQRGGDYRVASPVARYARDTDAPVAGGIVYRGSAAPGLAGRFVLADSGSGLIASLRPGRNGKFSVEPMTRAGALPGRAAGPMQVSTFGESRDGELLLLDRTRGEIRRLVFAAASGIDNVPDLLSETGCLNTASAGAPPLLDLIPYGVNAAFWSDGAHKERWLGLPDGEVINVPDSGDWDLPIGTVIVKHFRIGDRLVETRLFMRHPDGGWAGYTYQWNDAQTDATRVRGGLVASAGGQPWVYPSEDDCMFCHNEAAGFSLGLETAQQNGDHEYPQTGRTRNQITTLNAIHVLSPPVADGAPVYPDPFDEAQPLESRARSYLHTNCSFCHRPGGPTPAHMDLRYDMALAATGACDVTPTLGDLGIPDARIIAPGEPDRSELLARMSRRDFNGMPPIASLQPDAEGVALIRTWIESLTPASCR